MFHNDTNQLHPVIIMDISLHKSVKKIWTAPYTLKTKRGGGTRHGSLLKVEFCSGKTGHADLHPYPEKGEMALKIHLEKMKQGVFTSLCLRSIAIAYEEARARAGGINLPGSLKIPLSHYLILDIDNFSKKNTGEAVLSRGFSVFKVKLNHPLKRQTKILLNLMRDFDSRVKWRLDFYSNLNRNQWLQWKQDFSIQLNQEHLDFIEAPFDYKESIWMENKTHPLALDTWGGRNTLPVPVLVWKSSRVNPEELFKRWSLVRRVVFTHTLSHPLDQLAGAYFAARFYKVNPHLMEVCGLVQMDVYEKHDFTLPDYGPCFPRLSGVGWGFNSILLDRLHWKKCFF